MIEKELTDSEYSAALVPDWARAVSDGCVQELKCVSADFKFIGARASAEAELAFRGASQHSLSRAGCVCVARAANCTIVQKLGAGVCCSSAALWDADSDGCITVRWENEHMSCLMFVAGCQR